jgi:hypothetical protein
VSLTGMTTAKADETLKTQGSFFSRVKRFEINDGISL